jgi:MFS family permease
MAELRMSGPAIGLVLSGALVGTMLLTLVVALRGDRIGRRRLLAAGAALMTLALLIPLVRGDLLVLILVGLTGMVAVTSNESSGLQSIDQAVLPQTVPDAQRTSAFALYNVVSAALTALGSLAVGPLLAAAGGLGLAGPERFAPAFVVYAVTGVVALLAALRLDRGAETGGPVERGFGVRRSRGVVARLSVLFGVDSFAGGLVVQSFLAYWFATRFGVAPTTIGALFFGGSLLSAASFPVAAWLAGRIGLVNTMVFTHIPASMLLIGMAVAPVAEVAALLYLLRAALSSMDVPTRQSYTMAVVDPAERTATAGVTSLARSAAQAAGPLLAGTVLVPLGVGAPLVACAVLKIGYDVALFSLFRRHPAPGETRSPAGRW